MTGGALRSASMDDFDLRMSEQVRPLYEAVKAFIRDEVDPITEEFHRLGDGRADRWRR
jgi:acyl-CoA dehydrogenase